MLNIILWFILIILIIATIVVSIFLSYTIRPLLKQKSYELFEYHFQSLCIADFNTKNDLTDLTKYCVKDGFYGNQVCILNWKSNKERERFVCFYYLLQSSLNKDDKVYTNSNYWITVYDKKTKETGGSARWSNLYVDKLKSGGRKTTVPFTHSVMTATSGILSHLQGVEILTDYRDSIRKIYMYSKGMYYNKDYENYKKKSI
jgi:hypothetical protein